MAGGLGTLLLFSIAMALASLGAGFLPLVISLSSSQSRLISNIGMGVLVGTSMIVIIPEGIDTIYSAKSPPIQTLRTSSEPAARSIWVPGHQTTQRDIPILYLRDEGAGDHGHTHTDPNTGGVIDAPPASGGEGGDQDQDHDHDHGNDHDHDHDHDQDNGSDTGAHKWVGLSLVSGFILMYLIDVIPAHTHSTAAPYHIALDSLHSLHSPPDTPLHPHSSRPASTTLGLVIHAAADGIALGASSTSSNVALEAIIFVAIMLHKAPAAFGLSAVLLRAGLGKRQAKMHLVVFSMAAPVGALVTWVLVNMLGGEEVGGAGMQWWTGVLLLFSGGTFLYVAMHTMMEQAAMAEKPGVKDTCAAVFGMLLPLLTQVGHHHH